MFCCRVIVFLFSVLFTACAVCANFFPIYRSEVEAAGVTVTNQFYYRYYQTETKVGGAVSTKSTLKYSDVLVNGNCEEVEIFWLASFILAIAGAACGGIGMILAFAHLFVRGKCGLCGSISVFFSLAFGCFGACVALPTVMYASDRCPVSETGLALYPKLEDRGFNMVEGFGLTCAACGGFLILIFFECCS